MKIVSNLQQTWLL